MSDSKRMPRTLPGSAQSRKVFQPVLLPPLSARNLSRSSYPDAPVLRLFSPFRDDSAHAVCKKGRRGNLADWSHRAAFSRPFCFSGIPFRSAGEAAVKNAAQPDRPPFACLSLRFAAPPWTALRFQGHRLGTIFSAQCTGRHHPEGKSQSRDRRRVG